MKDLITTLFAKIKTGFMRMLDARLVEKARSIINGLTGNDNFPTPSPTLETVSASLAAYQTAITDAANRDRAMIVIRKQAKLNLVTLLNSLADYVTFTANGDASILAGSNFDFYKQRMPVVITQPQNVRVTNGSNSGDITLTCKAVKGARAYIHQYMSGAEKEGSWVNVNCTSAKCTITGLTPGTLYWFRIAAVGGRGGQVVYSESVSRYAL